MAPFYRLRARIAEKRIARTTAVLADARTLSSPLLVAAECSPLK